MLRDIRLVQVHLRLPRQQPSRSFLLLTDVPSTVPRWFDVQHWRVFPEELRAPIDWSKREVYLRAILEQVVRADRAGVQEAIYGADWCHGEETNFLPLNGPFELAELQAKAAGMDAWRLEVAV